MRHTDVKSSHQKKGGLLTEEDLLVQVYYCCKLDASTFSRHDFMIYSYIVIVNQGTRPSLLKSQCHYPGSEMFGMASQFAM